MMARMARLVVPGIPHHITQRGNRRQETFFHEDDYHFYISNLAEWCRRCSVEIWAYCLMPNHVHLIAVPSSPDGLRRAIGETHKRYSARINGREGWRGHLWQGRFASYPLDEPYLLAATRYIEMNPVRARLVPSPEKYPWSSARAHLTGGDDLLVRGPPFLDIVGNWKNFLSGPISQEQQSSLKRHEKNGRPLGSSRFIHILEQTLDRNLQLKKPGPKPRWGRKLNEVTHRLWEQF
jgi:putative transposase